MFVSNCVCGISIEVRRNCTFLLFCGPCIVIYLRNKNQDALFYSQFISVINLYMFRAGLLLIIRGYVSVYTAIGMCLCWLAASG